MNPVATNYTFRRAGRELVLSGVLNATPEEVFEAWVRADQLAKWWVCDGGSPLWCEIDARPGGLLAVMEKGRLGRWVILEVVRNRRLIFTDSFEEAWVPSRDPGMVFTVTLEEVAGRTRYSLQTAFWSELDAEQYAVAGGLDRQSQAFERLASLVEE